MCCCALCPPLMFMLPPEHSSSCCHASWSSSGSSPGMFCCSSWNVWLCMHCCACMHHDRLWDMLKLVEWQLLGLWLGMVATGMCWSVWVHGAGKPGHHLLHERAKAAVPLLNGSFVREIYLQQIKSNRGENSQATECMHLKQHTKHKYTQIYTQHTNTTHTTYPCTCTCTCTCCSHMCKHTCIAKHHVYSQHGHTQ